MANTSELDQSAASELVRFKCSPELKKTIGHWAVDDGTTEQAILLRLLTDAVQREEKRRLRA